MAVSSSGRVSSGRARFLWHRPMDSAYAKKICNIPKEQPIWTTFGKTIKKWWRNALSSMRNLTMYFSTAPSSPIRPIPGDSKHNVAVFLQLACLLENVHIGVRSIVTPSLCTIVAHGPLTVWIWSLWCRGSNDRNGSVAVCKALQIMFSTL